MEQSPFGGRVRKRFKHLCKKQLLQEAIEKGFCSLSNSVEKATAKVGTKPTFNKLGVIVKDRAGKQKARNIWNLKESGVNKLCSHGERVLLPKLSAVVSDALDVFRKGGAIPRSLPSTLWTRSSTCPLDHI